MTTTDHAFVRPTPFDARAPCPALNALANQGYIPRDGRNISFTQLLFATRRVYNLSLPLAFVLTFVGFATSAHITWTGFLPSITLTLSDLSAHGLHKIAHDASLVHPNGVEATSPDPTLVARLVHSSSADRRHGISLSEMAALHKEQVGELGHPLDDFHEQVAAGECGLAWAVMRSRKKSGGDEDEDVIPTNRVEEWFGEERLPDDWWNGARPEIPINLFEARRKADIVAQCE